jgi:EmrB/QacA subfamily drug resistance transporter
MRTNYRLAATRNLYMNTDTATLKNSSASAATSQTGTHPTGIRKWVPLIILSLALMIIILDTTILNVSLRTIINDLHTNIQSIQWVITAYALMLAAFTVTGGRLGDLFGRKRMFVVGAIIFAVGSFITSISGSVGIMVLGEAIIEGVGAALMLPATTSLLISNYHGRDRQIGFGIWGGIAAGAAALGPVFGGWLTTYYSWRWAFRINVVVAALLVFGSFLVKEAIDAEERSDIDFVGIALSALGLLSIVFGLIKASTYGWWMAQAPFTVWGYTLPLGGLSATPYFIVLGIVILFLFTLWERHVALIEETPLVSLKLFTNKQFTLGASITALLSLGQAGVSFIIPVFLQSVLNLSPLQTGYAMLPMSLTLLVAAPFSAYISKFISPKRIIQFGLILDGIGFWVLAISMHANSGQWALAPGFMFFGVGLGLMMSQTSNLTLSAVSVEQSGEASGVNTTLRQVGSTLGSAILGAILLSALGASLISGVNRSTIIPSALKPSITKTVSRQSSNIEFGNGASVASAGLPAKVGAEIVAISKNATVDASRITLYYGIIFVVLAFLLSLGLPGSADVEANKSVAYIRYVEGVEMIARKRARIRGLVFAVVVAIIVGTISYRAGIRAGEQQEISAQTASANNSAVPAEALQFIPTNR